MKYCASMMIIVILSLMVCMIAPTHAYTMKSLLYTADHNRRHCIWIHPFDINKHTPQSTSSTMLLCEADIEYQILDVSPSTHQMLVKMTTAQGVHIKLYNLINRQFLTYPDLDKEVIQARFITDNELLFIRAIPQVKSKTAVRTQVISYKIKEKSSQLLYHHSRPLQNRFPLSLSPDRQWAVFMLRHAKQSLTIIPLTVKQDKIKQQEVQILKPGYVTLTWNGTQHDWNAFFWPTRTLNYSSANLADPLYRKKQTQHKKAVKNLKEWNPSHSSRANQPYSRRTSKKSRQKMIQHISALPYLSKVTRPTSAGDLPLQVHIHQTHSHTYQVQCYHDAQIMKNSEITKSAYLNFQIPITQQILYRADQQQFLWFEMNANTTYVKAKNLQIKAEGIQLSSQQTILTIPTRKVVNMFLSTYTHHE